MWRGQETSTIPFMQDKIATFILDLSGTPEASASAHGVAQELDIPYATVHKMLRKVI